MSVHITIIDMKLKSIEIDVDKNTTIGELRKLYISRGGDGRDNQWKYDGNILRNDSQKLKDIEGFDPEEMAFSVLCNIRGGQIKIVDKNDIYTNIYNLRKCFINLISII